MLNFIYRPATRRAYAQLLARAAVSVIFIPLVAVAQTRGRDPLDPKTAASSAPYQSAFSDYKSYLDPELMPWRVANDTVREFGGMAGIKDMADMKASDRADDKSGGMESSNQPAKPSHDMGNMKGEMRTPAAKTPASTGDKPAAMENMPGHDMGDMTPAKSKAQPAPRQPVPSAPGSMPDHGSMSH